jgi:CPA1 family monovalent cation:H+ antiporter
MTAAQRLLATLVLMSVVAVLLRALSRRGPLPYPVVLAGIGVAVGAIPGVPVRSIGSDAILLGFVPGLVFHASLTLHREALRRVLAPVVALATAGVAFTVAGISVVVHAALGLSWTDSILLGAILAPTDPIAVVALLRRLGAHDELVAMLEGESLFNDGTGIAVFAAIVSTLDSHDASAANALSSLALITFGGLAIGIVAGTAGLALLAAIREAETAILATIAIAYGSYLLADIAHVSGVVAVVASGLVVAGASSRLATAHRSEAVEFWDVVAFVLNALLFLLIGAALPVRDVVAQAGPVLVAFGIMLAARLVTVHLILGALDPRVRRFTLGWRTIAVWGGMRGALSVALALVVAARNDVDHRVALLAYGAALVSIVLQGGTLPLVARRHGGAAGAPGISPGARRSSRRSV